MDIADENPDFIGVFAILYGKCRDLSLIHIWFTMGGASSHDIQDGVLDPEDPDFEQKYWLLRRMRGMFRGKGRSWWAEEMPNAREYAEACLLYTSQQKTTQM